MNAALTGGTGFIGGRLAEKLIEGGHSVKCLVRDASNVNNLKKIGASLFYGNLDDHHNFDDFVKDADVVYHVAAMVSDWGDRADFFKINIEATNELLRSSKKSNVKRFIYLSSSTVIWKSDLFHVHKLSETDELYPYPREYNDYYNETKAEAEKLVIRFYLDTGLEAVVVRPSNVWGAGDRVILPRIAKAAEKGFLYSIGWGEKWVSPCNVGNLVHALLLASENKNAPGNIYFINDGMKIDHNSFLSDLLKASGISWSSGITIPYTLAYALAAFMEIIFKLMRSEKPPVLTRFAVAAIAGSRTYSIEKAKKQLGYHPVISYDEGLKQLGGWVQQIGGMEKLLQ